MNLRDPNLSLFSPGHIPSGHFPPDRSSRDRTFSRVFERNVVSLIFCLVCLGSLRPENLWGAAPYQRPEGNPHQSRSVTVAKHGIVATSQPQAAQIGLDILKQGGNAADAAIAASAAIGLMEPMSCGIGGDLFVLYWDSKTQKLYGLNASGRSPYTLTREVFRNLGHLRIPSHGPLSWSVPGCVDGWETLRTRFGSLALATLLAPSITAAEEGFPVTEIIAGYWEQGRVPLQQFPDTAKTYYPGGIAPKEGELFKNPYLAKSYRLIAEQGRDAFYKGEIARRIVDYSEKNGGHFSLRDFEEHASEWVEPVTTNYRGYDVWQLPPNGQGLCVLQMLNILEGYDLKALGSDSPEYLHLFLEAKKLSYADRARHFADPAFGPLPVQQMASKEYAAERRKFIDPSRAATGYPPGDFRLATGDTIYLTVVDKDRNCCSFIQSNFHGFGSLHVAGETGFALQNRGALFALDEQHPNRLEPHKRPFHTIIPGFVTKAGKPWLSFGVMGGDMQPQGQVQVLINLIDFGMNLQEAGDAARVQHSGSPTPTGLEGDPSGGSVGAEAGFPEATISGLRAKGHQVQVGGAYGGYQGILIDHAAGTLRGATESRKDGAAVGY